MLKFLWFCLLGVVGGVTILAGLYLPGAYTEFLSWLPFLFAAFALTGSVYLMNDYSLSRSISWRRTWDVLRVLPRAVQLGLVLALVVTVVYHYLAMSGPDPLDLLEFQQCYVFAAVWMCAVASAFTYGAVIRLRGNNPPDREERQAGWAVTGVVWGVALMGAFESMWLSK